MSLLLLFQPGISAGPPPPPPPALPAPPALPGDGGAWARGNLLRAGKKKKALQREDRELIELIRAMAPQLLYSHRRLSNERDLLALIKELAPDFLKNRRRVN